MYVYSVSIMNQDFYLQGELYWTHHWQKNFTIPELGNPRPAEKWEEQDKFPDHDDVSDTSSR